MAGMLVRSRVLKTSPPVLLALGLSACASLQGWQGESAGQSAASEASPVPAGQASPALPDAASLPAPADTRSASLAGAERSPLVGKLQRVSAWEEDTLAEIARDYSLGFDELRHANPGVDPWLPGQGTPVLLPGWHILPSVRQGIVLNLASRRLFHFDQQAGLVHTYPVGVGREGWSTPTGKASVTAKVKDPVWFVPASIRREHAEAGDPLPARVEPGPDNPLGGYALQLDMPGYLIHGTNKPYGVGMRVSHGCIRLYPEDIEALFQRVPVGTPVTILNEPVMVAAVDGVVYLEAHRPLAEDTAWQGSWEQLRARLLADERLAAAAVDWALVQRALEQGLGIPLPVSHGAGKAPAVLVRHRRPPPAPAEQPGQQDIAVAEAQATP